MTSPATSSPLDLSAHDDISAGDLARGGFSVRDDTSVGGLPRGGFSRGGTSRGGISAGGSSIGELARVADRLVVMAGSVEELTR